MVDTVAFRGTNEVGGRWDAIVRDELAPIAVLGVGVDGVVVRSLASAARSRSGVADPEGRPVADVVPGPGGENLVAAARAAVAGWWSLELDVGVGPLGSGRLKVLPVGHDGDDALVLVFGSIVEQPLLDEVTGLPTRTVLADRWQQALTVARRRHTGVALLFLDLDRFKAVNDRYGHQAGDRVLREVGRRITAILRAGDTLVRHGGDEFVVIVEAEPHESLRVADRIVASVEAPMDVGDHEVEIGISVGAAVVGPTDRAPSLPEAIATADRAMYEAKTAGGCRVETV